MHALNAYNACIMKKEIKQYTIRRIPRRVDQLLREKAVQYGMSLNETVLDALSRGLGMQGEEIEYHDLDDLAGTWIQDEDFDRAMKDMNRIDEDLWR